MRYGQFSSQERSRPTPPPAFSRAPAPTPVAASYRELRRARAAADQRWKVDEGRKGVLGAWLTLTAPRPASALASLTERERLRKAELSAYVLFGVLVMGLALIPNGLVNRPTLLSAAIIIASAVLAAVLNRANHTMVAALVLIVAFCVALGGALVTTPRLDLMWMPALDFFAVPVLLAGLLLTRWAPFVAAALGSAAVVALLELKPRDSWLSTMVAHLGVYHFMVRPIALMLVVAIASWLWSRSVEQAIRRADRAEEVAAMEHQLAEQKRQLDRGIQNLLETHVRVANGDFSARAATAQDNVLWQIAVSLNNLLSRLAKYAHLEQRLQHTEQAVDRLAGVLETAQAGYKPALPAPSGTHVDRLLAALASRPLHLRGPASASATAHRTRNAAEAYAPPTVWMPGRAQQRAAMAREPRSTPPITGQWREVPGRPQSERRAANGAVPDAQGEHTPYVPPRPAESVNEFRSAPVTPTDSTTRPAGQAPSRGASETGAAPAWPFPQAQSQGKPGPQAWSEAPEQRDTWHAPTPQRPPAPPWHWAMKPLPPLRPLTQDHTGAGTTSGASGSQADGQTDTSLPNGHADAHGAASEELRQPLPYGFSESFPGQLQHSAHAQPSRPFVVQPAAEWVQPQQHTAEAEDTTSLPTTEGASQPREHDAKQEGGRGQGNKASRPVWQAFRDSLSLDNPEQ